MSYGQRQPATQAASSYPTSGLLGRVLAGLLRHPNRTEERERARDRRQPWGKGTGRASYAVVQRRRRANRMARRSRRINRAAR